MHKFLILTSLIFTSFAQASLVSNKEKPLKKIEIECKKNELTRNETTAETILSALKKKGYEVKTEGNSFQFVLNELPIYIVFDEKADRMRIVAPIAEMKNVTDEQVKKSLQANFHTALDARYAISNDVLWSVFVHPLSELSETFLQSAIEQVFTAAATFGTEYSSGYLSFPKSGE